MRNRHWMEFFVQCIIHSSLLPTFHWLIDQQIQVQYSQRKAALVNVQKYKSKDISRLSMLVANRKPIIYSLSDTSWILSVQMPPCWLADLWFRQVFLYMNFVWTRRGKRVIYSWVRVKESDLAWVIVGFPRDTGEGPAFHRLIKSNKRENLSWGGVSTAINSYTIIK